MSTFIFDIETGPRSRAELAECVPTFEAPSNWKDPEKIRALGHEVVQGEPVELHAEDLIGRTLRARLKVEEFNGRANNKVEAWLAPLAGSGNAPAPAPRASAPTAPTTVKKEDDANEPF